MHKLIFACGVVGMLCSVQSIAMPQKLQGGKFGVNIGMVQDGLGGVVRGGAVAGVAFMNQHFDFSVNANTQTYHFALKDPSYSPDVKQPWDLTHGDVSLYGVGFRAGYHAPLGKVASRHIFWCIGGIFNIMYGKPSDVENTGIVSDDDRGIARVLGGGIYIGLIQNLSDHVSMTFSINPYYYQKLTIENGSGERPSSDDDFRLHLSSEGFFSSGGISLSYFF